MIGREADIESPDGSPARGKRSESNHQPQPRAQNSDRHRRSEFALNNCRLEEQGVPDLRAIWIVFQYGPGGFMVQAMRAERPSQKAKGAAGCERVLDGEESGLTIDDFRLVIFDLERRGLVAGDEGPAHAAAVFGEGGLGNSADSVCRGDERY